MSFHTDRRGPDPRHDGHTPACPCASTRRPQSTNRWRHPLRSHLPRRTLSVTTRTDQKTMRRRSSRSSSHICRQALGRSALPMLFSIEWRPSAHVRKAVHAGRRETRSCYCGVSRLPLPPVGSPLSREGVLLGSCPQCPPTVKRTRCLTRERGAAPIGVRRPVGRCPVGSGLGTAFSPTGAVPDSRFAYEWPQGKPRARLGQGEAHPGFPFAARLQQPGREALSISVAAGLLQPCDSTVRPTSIAFGRWPDRPPGPVFAERSVS